MSVQAFFKPNASAIAFSISMECWVALHRFMDGQLWVVRLNPNTDEWITVRPASERDEADMKDARDWGVQFPRGRLSDGKRLTAWELDLLHRWPYQPRELFDFQERKCGCGWPIASVTDGAWKITACSLMLIGKADGGPEAHVIPGTGIEFAPVIIPAASTEPLYYIQNIGYQGNCMKFWRPEGKGYTVNLFEAWKVTKEKADEICRSRPQEDIPWLASEIDASARLHADVEILRSIKREAAK